MILIGKSPLLTVHDADTISMALISSSPKLNGTICGNTTNMASEADKTINIVKLTEAYTLDEGEQNIQVLAKISVRSVSNTRLECVSSMKVGDHG